MSEHVKRLLFVCIENSNRSQMAEAFARIHGGERIESFSAGSRPSGVVNPKAIRAMAEIGYDLSAHTSKSLHDLPEVAFDSIVGMGCGDACPWIPAKQRLEWDIPDPKHLEPVQFNQIRDLIEEKVKELIRSIQQD